MYDTRIENFLVKHYNSFQNKINNQEFIHLLENCKNNIKNQKEEKSERVTELENIAENKSKQCINTIHSIIRKAKHNDWDEESMNDWKNLRKIVLTNPTLNEEDIHPLKNIYIELPEPSNQYYYHTSDDFKTTKISFDKRTIGNIDYSILNESSSRLDTFMKNKQLKSFFEKNGYATTFNKGNYMICPPIFRNIYTGALGEVVGKYLFDNHIFFSKQHLLEEIDDVEKFELFDYKYKNKVYFDFKNWGDSSLNNIVININEIKEKLKKCKGEKAIIANIIPYNNNKAPECRLYDNILFVEGIYDEDDVVNYDVRETIRKFIGWN